MNWLLAGWTLTSPPMPKFFQSIASPPKPRKKPLRVLLDFVALFSFDFIVLVDVEVVGVGIRGGREHDFVDVFEAFGIEGSELTASAHDLAVFVELEVQHRCMQVVEPRVKTPPDYFAGGVATKVAEFGRMLVHAGVIHDDCPAIAQAT